MLKKFKEYIQRMHPNMQIYEVNEMIDLIEHSKIDDIKKIELIINLKQIRYSVHILQQNFKNIKTSEQNTVI